MLFTPPHTFFAVINSPTFELQILRYFATFTKRTIHAYQQGYAVVTIFIADDSQPFRDALARVLNTVKGVQIVGQASSGKEALNSIRLTRPDVVILDLFMPEMNGIEVLRNMRREAISSMVLVVTNHADAYTRDASKRAGADYFLDKSFESQRIAPILESLVGVFSLKDESIGH